MRQTNQSTGDVARKIGVTTYAVRSWLGGHAVPQSTSLRRLEAALELDAGYLRRYLNAEQVSAVEHAVVNASELDEESKAKMIQFYDELRGSGHSG
jgi:hypothetical protein